MLNAMIEIHVFHKFYKNKMTYIGLCISEMCVIKYIYLI